MFARTYTATAPQNDIGDLGLCVTSITRTLGFYIQGIIGQVLIIDVLGPCGIAQALHKVVGTCGSVAASFTSR